MKTSTHLSALVLITFLTGAGTALAARHDNHHDHGRRGMYAHMGRRMHEHAIAAHDWRQHHWRHGHVVYDNQYVTYAPPVVVDSTSDYDEDESEPGINLVFPLNIH